MNSIRYALCMGTAIAVLTACSESRLANVPGTRPTLAIDAGHRGSWMLPEAVGKDLLYVSAQSKTNVYTFPGGKVVGAILNTGYTGGLCSDTKGDVFITTQYAIYEYPHGVASPIATLTDPQLGGYGCSVDTATGNLAVISTVGAAIYRPAPHHEWHLPRLFSIKPNVLYGGYDGSGNLFVDGQVIASEPFFFELRKGGSRFQSVTLDESVAHPGNIEWDGTYLAIGDNKNLLVHRYAFNGTHGTQVGTVTLSGPNQIRQFWIQGNVFIGPAFKDTYFVGLWQYPHGGVRTKIVDRLQAYGATVSLATH